MTTQKTKKQATQPITEDKRLGGAHCQRLKYAGKTALLAIMLACPEGTTLPELANALWVGKKTRCKGICPRWCLNE